MTYGDLYESVNNVWSILFSTGYLAVNEKNELIIPNEEIRSLFLSQISSWFNDIVTKNESSVRNICEAFLTEDVTSAEEGINSFLKNTISIRDTNSRTSMKENFYHGILLGLLERGSAWEIKSNAKAGDGYADILVYDEDSDICMVFELKYAHDGNLDKACDVAITADCRKKI
ncbi:MAG: PD-(D/E)XK nuclease domain-containing protein [Lachnospiraceae bacterium]|nr:PD-(D/E)XK nuclease domain-containing protein [Lachnospiraceae bacterium]